MLNLPNVGEARWRTVRLTFHPTRIGVAGNRPDESQLRRSVREVCADAPRACLEQRPVTGSVRWGVCHGRGGERRRTGSGSQGWTEWGCALGRQPVSRPPAGSCVVGLIVALCALLGGL